MKRFCPACGAEVSTDAQFCPSCGAPQDPPTTPSGSGSSGSANAGSDLERTMPTPDDVDATIPSGGIVPQSP